MGDTGLDIRIAKPAANQRGDSTPLLIPAWTLLSTRVRWYHHLGGLAIRQATAPPLLYTHFGELQDIKGITPNFRSTKTSPPDENLVLKAAYAEVDASN